VATHCCRRARNSLHYRFLTSVTERFLIRRPPFERRPETNTQRINHQIRIPQIRVIGPEGEQLGIMSPQEGRRIAEGHGLDLVEVAADARPPVCKILNYDKYRYEQSKRKSASKSDRVEVKIIRMRPRTDEHDLDTKLRKVKEFLAKGHKVKLEMAMRGRERAYIGRWVAQLNEIAAGLVEHGKVSSPARPDGRMVGLLIEPVLAPAAASPGTAASPAGETPQAAPASAPATAKAPVSAMKPRAPSAPPPR
jgi:translation initiation factor IF-3